MGHDDYERADQLDRDGIAMARGSVGGGED